MLADRHSERVRLPPLPYHQRSGDQSFAIVCLLLSRVKQAAGAVVDATRRTERMEQARHLLFACGHHARFKPGRSIAGQGGRSWDARGVPRK